MRNRKTTAKRPETPLVIGMQGPVTAATAESWRSRLAEALHGTVPVVIDVSGAEAWDSIGLQVLCSARRTASDRGIALAIEGRTGAFDEACACIGIEVAMMISAGSTQK